MLPTSRIKELVIKQMDEGLTAGEQRELTDWMNQSSLHREAVEEFLVEDKLKKGITELFKSRATIWSRIEQQLPQKEAAPVKRLKVWRWVAAAAILAVFSTGAYWLLSRSKEDRDHVAKTNVINDIKAPVSNRATITLADGSMLYLDSAMNGSLATVGDVQIVKQADGKISYTGSANQLIYNTLTNPRGSKVIDVTLSDGTRVWLNAGSSLKYPVAFVGDERRVAITGEAYFEVAHNASRPFKVSKDAMEVTVLGTHFNVNAYEDEPDIKVTLLEGSVKVSDKGQSAIIMPGEQAVATSNYKLQTRNSVDLEATVAWKNGLFTFNKTDIGKIMREVERWYDVQVVYEGAKPTLTLSGTIKRNINISRVLQMLELSGLHFRIEGSRIIVKP